MKIETFSDLVTMAAADPEPSKLLVVLIGVEAAHRAGPDGSEVALENEGSLTPMMVRDLDMRADLTLEEVVAEADTTGQLWQFLLLAVLPGRDGQAPDDDDCDTCLKRMAKAVLSGGDLSCYVCFNRQGAPVSFGKSLP